MKIGFRNILNIVLLLLFILFVLYIYSFNQSVKYVDFGDPDSKIKLCFIAGVHGNEPAASMLLEEMIKTDVFEKICKDKRIFIRILPSVNEFGLKFGIRYQNSIINPDINRTFTNEGNDIISREIIELTKDSTLIIDFHEGWGFHLIEKDSLGSTLTVTKGLAEEIGIHIVDRLNQKIYDQEKKFVILDRICDIESAFSCYSNRHEKNYILVETSGQGDIQPLSVRYEQIQTIINTVLLSL